MKVQDLIKPFLTKKTFDSTVCITVNDEELIFNPGDTLDDLEALNDVSSKAVKHAYVQESVLFIEVKEDIK